MTSSAGSRSSNALGAYRFLFAIVVCLIHFQFKGNFSPDGPGAFSEANAAVSFFSIASGYFLMSSIQRAWAAQKEGKPVSSLVGGYAARRYARLFPQYALSLSMYLILRVFILQTMPIQRVLNEGFLEFFMLQCFGFPRVTLVFWYVSALLVGSVLVYWAALVLRDHFVVAVAFVSPLIYGTFCLEYGNIGLTIQPAVLGTVGLWRVVAGLGLGILVYHAAAYLRPIVEGRFALLFTVLELGLLPVMFHVLYRTWGDDRDFTLVALFAILLLSIFLEQSYLTRLLDNPVSAYLGKISYGYYLNQAVFIHAFGPIIPMGDYWPSAALYLVCNFVLSAITYPVVQALSRLAGRVWAGLKQGRVGGTE